MADRSCAHDGAVEDHGALVCRGCGLVLETHLLAEEDWRTAAPEESDPLWTRAVRRVLAELGFADAGEMAEAVRRPPGLSWKGSSLDAPAAAVIYLQWSGLLSQEHARAASGAPRKQWERALALAGGGSCGGGTDDLGEDLAFVRRECGKRGLPPCFEDAALRVLEEPAFESCSPLHILMALAEGSLGEDVAAALFRAPVSKVRLLSSRYQLRGFAPDLSRAAKRLEERVRACAPAREDALVQHVKSCSGCSHYAEHGGLGFLLRV